MKLQSAAFMRDMTAAANSVNSNTAQMKRSMREMESESRKSAAAMQSLTTGLVRFGAAVGVSFGVREIVNFGREVAKMTADLDDQAKSAGLSVSLFRLTGWRQQNPVRPPVLPMRQSVNTREASEKPRKAIGRPSRFSKPSG